jgi:hypothetical protein
MWKTENAIFQLQGNCEIPHSIPVVRMLYDYRKREFSCCYPVNESLKKWSLRGTK